MATEYAQELSKLAAVLDEAKQEINLARQQSIKHQHLRVRTRRAAVQAARAVAAAVDLGFPRVWPQGKWTLSSLRNPDDPDRKPVILRVGNFEAEVLSMQFGSGCNPDGTLRDDTALALWVQSMCPVMRSKQVASKAGAGTYDFPTVKMDEQGKILGRNGKPLEAIEKCDPETGAPAGWELSGPAAKVTDDYDDVDKLEYLRCQAADWADACEIAADLIRTESRNADLAGRAHEPFWNQSEGTQSSTVPGRRVWPRVIQSAANEFYPPPPDNWDGRVDSWPAAKQLGYLIDYVTLGPTPAWGNVMPIWSFDCIAVPGNTPSIYPNAEPSRKPQREWLPDIEKRFRELGLIDNGHTIHWVGSQSKPGQVCGCFRIRSQASVGDSAIVDTSTDSELFIFATHGDGYSIAGFGERGQVRALKGFHQLAQLIRTPGRPVPMIQLAGGADDPRIIADAHSRQPVADSDMLRQLHQRRQVAKEEMERAQLQNDTVDASHCQEEIDAVDSQLRRLTGIGGKVRDLNNPADTLRPTIHANLKRAYVALRKAQPPMRELAAHFEASVGADGAAFVYGPIGTIPPWAFEMPYKK